MDYRNEISVGEHHYAIRAKGESGEGGEFAMVTLEFTGADTDGRVIGEGNIQFAVEALDTASRLLVQTLDGMAALHGRGGRGRTRPSRPLPPNAGKPWSAEHGEQLCDQWLRSSAAMSAKDVTDDLARQFGRTRSAIRAQLARLGCDPDVPGRQLAAADEP